MEPVFENDEAQLMIHYQEEGITEFPKKTNGRPDMRKSENKKVLISLKKRQILKRNKLENQYNYTSKKEDNYRNEIINMNESDLDKFRKISNGHCSICYESLKSNHCLLPCEHYFCVSCIARHCRENNNCPLCRKEICCKAKKVERMNTYLIQAIYEIEQDQRKVFTVLNEEEKLYTFNDILYKEINDLEAYIDKYKYGHEPYNEAEMKTYKHELLINLLKNVYQLNSNISQKVIKFYDEQL
jgi:hypothetical protein